MPVWWPSDILSLLRSVGEEDCPYCLAFPTIPCTVHAGLRISDRAPEEAAEPVDQHPTGGLSC